MIATPVDFFFRRTGDLLFDIDSVKEWLDGVVKYMAMKFSWSEQVLAANKETLLNELKNATNPVEGK